VVLRIVYLGFIVPTAILLLDVMILILAPFDAPGSLERPS